MIAHAKSKSKFKSYENALKRPSVTCDDAYRCKAGRAVNTRGGAEHSDLRMARNQATAVVTHAG